MAAMLDGGRRQARLVEAFKWNAWERAHKPLGTMALSMTPGPGDRDSVSGIAGGKLRVNERKELFTSSASFAGSSQARACQAARLNCRGTR